MDLAPAAFRPFIMRWLRRCLILTGVCTLAYFVWWWCGPTRPLLFLASDIREWNSPDLNLTGDSIRLIRARCSEEQFHRYAHQQGFTERLAEDDPQRIGSWDTCPETWWNPPSTCQGAYYVMVQGKRLLLGYANGYLYYDLCFT